MISLNSIATLPKNRIPIFSGLSGDDVVILDKGELNKFNRDGDRIWNNDINVYRGLISTNKTLLVGSDKHVQILNENGCIGFKRPYGINYFLLSNDGSVIYEIITSTFLNNFNKTLFTQNKEVIKLPHFYSLSGDGTTFLEGSTSSAGMRTWLKALHIFGATWEYQFPAILKSLTISENGSCIFVGTTKGLHKFVSPSYEFNYSEEGYVEIELMLIIDDLSISDDGSVVLAKTKNGIYLLKNMVLQDKIIQGDHFTVSRDGQTIQIINNQKLSMYDNNLTLLWESKRLSQNSAHYNNQISIVNGDSIILTITEGYVQVFDKMGKQLWHYKGKHDVYEMGYSIELICIILFMIFSSIIGMVLFIFQRIKEKNK
jgi:outer membrane protein assembly factor BamB